MDIPLLYTSTENYRASLGHKINHSFAPNCRWDVVQHPVFGRIPRIVALVDIQKDQELTCHYMIDMQEAGANPNLTWYLEQWDIASKDDN